MGCLWPILTTPELIVPGTHLHPALPSVTKWNLCSPISHRNYYSLRTMPAHKLLEGPTCSPLNPTASFQGPFSCCSLPGWLVVVLKWRPGKAYLAVEHPLGALQPCLQLGPAGQPSSGHSIYDRCLLQANRVSDRDLSRCSWLVSSFACRKASSTTVPQQTAPRVST